MTNPSILEICSQVPHPELVQVGKGVTLLDLLNELRALQDRVEELELTIEEI